MFGAACMANGPVLNADMTVSTTKSAIHITATVGFCVVFYGLFNAFTVLVWCWEEYQKAVHSFKMQPRRL